MCLTSPSQEMESYKQNATRTYFPFVGVIFKMKHDYSVSKILNSLSHTYSSSNESSNIKSETKFQQFSHYSQFSNIHETPAPINI
jgi:hypothetical protein